MGLVGRSFALLLGGAASVVLAQGAAWAQEDGGTTTAAKQARVGTVLQRLVVGAGAEKVAIDTPQAVTVVDQEDIDREQATTTGEVFRTIPGVTMVGSDRLFGEAFNIRGIGATDSSGDGSRIVVTVDGAPKFNEQYRMGSFFSDPELYKRVEVLRGPASSTLYGSGALGGVINFTTKDASDFIAPDGTGTVRLKGSYGTNGSAGLVSALWAHRFSPNAEVLLTGNFRRSDDFLLANGTVLAGSAFNAWSGLAKGTVRFGEGDEQVLRLSYQRWQSAAKDQEYAQTGTQSFFGKTDRDVTDDTFVLSYENPASDNPWLDLNLALSYSNTRNSQKNHKPGFMEVAPGVFVPIASTGPGDVGQTAILNDTDYAYRTWQLKGDNTMEFGGDGWQNFLTTGVQLSHQQRVAGRAPGVAALQQHPEGTETKIGLFAQDELVLNDRFTVIAGARVDFHNMTPSAVIPGANAINGAAFSPKIAAKYDFNENFGIFGSVAHTERFPTLDELFSYSGTRTTSPNLQKESSNNYELGFTTAAYDIGGGSNALALKTTGFYNDLDNLIATGTVVGGPYYVNVNKARIYGVEVEGSFETDAFFSRLAYTWVRGENKLTGAPLTTIPQSTLALTVGARYEPWALEYGARAVFAAKGDYVLPAASGGVGAADPWTTVDLFASWKPTDGAFAGTEAQFSIENLFNADYRPNLATDRSKGRTFKITLAKSFGYN
jgi:hemoglobin/transferrin/lactoferrin receptor protein